MPEPAIDALPVLKLRRHEEKRLRGGHLWVFSNEVDTSDRPLTDHEPGSIVRVHDSRDRFVGHAYVNPHALICARILSRDEHRPIGPALFVERLRTALALRQRLYRHECYRLVYGESDGLPGLVLDRFGDVVVGQLTTLGMERLRPWVEAAVREVVGPRVLVWKHDGSSRDLEKLPKEVVTAFGDLPDAVTIVEDGLTFTAPLAGGQKTGWFYDQAINRDHLRRYVVPGARVLDVCSYVGAWALSALRHGAGSAACVDASQSALDAAQRNAAANGFPLDVHRGDAFDVLAQLADAGERYDLVIVDPPAFIKRRKDQHQGEAAYRRLNQLAMKLLTDDALLVSCSCSYHLAQETLPGLLQAAAANLGRNLQVLEFGGQSPDHPVHPAIVETRYLKTLFCRVTR
jgi:23S rRNA (cytosine1962-C5)-methyltransferase